MAAARALIIGGGIGGLCTAIALRRGGIDAHVFEQADALREVGAGLTIWTNAAKVLRRLDVADKVISSASITERFQLRTWHYITDRKPIGQWGRGRVTLLGDAAHPMTPNFGQGACQAMEDAIVLADCLAGASDVSESLQAYVARRRDRTAFITRASRRFGAVSQWENPCLCWLRDAITKSGVARRSGLKQFEEMLGYEVPASSGP